MEVVVATGTWLYDGVVPTVVRVVETDYDFWFELGKSDDQLEQGDVPHLNHSGRVYYVRYRSGWSPSVPFWPDSGGFMSLDAAKAAAENGVARPLSWA